MLIRFICDFVVDGNVKLFVGILGFGLLIEVFLFLKVVCDRLFCFFKILVNLFVKVVLLIVRDLKYYIKK